MSTSGRNRWEWLIIAAICIAYLVALSVFLFLLG
jgi:hypothetical protein